MIVRIGGYELNPRSTATGYGARRQVQGPTVAPGVNVSGLSDLAGAVAGMGAAGQRYYATRVEEEDQRRKYEALEKWNRFSGEFSRRIEDAKLAQPVDGSGYTSTVAKEYQTGWDSFAKEIPADLLPEFRVKGEALKQEAIIGADNWTREQTKAHAVFSVKERTDAAAKAVYLNPNAPVEDGLAEVIAAAPGLDAQAKETLADQALRSVNSARFGGVMREGREKSFVVPYSAEVNRRLVPIVIGKESGGRSDAVSPVGAVGLMQVMPATGKEIADDLQDPNFPADPKDWAAYLKKPDVNRLYGTFYLNQLLRQFNGDLEAALIGYNAGPGRAQTFIESGRNWAAMPDGVISETKPYVEGIMREFGALTPEMAFDPKYGLDFDQALAAEGEIEGILDNAQREADAQVRAKLAAADAAQDQAMNELFFRAEAGEDFRPMYVRAIADGEAAYDRSAMTAGIEISNRVRAETIKTEKAQREYGVGAQLSAEDGDRIITPDLRAGLLARDEKAITSVVQRSAKMGFVPPATQGALEQMLYSRDLQTMAAGAQVVTTIQRMNPAALRSLPDELVARAISLETLRSTGTPSDELQAYMQQTRTPEGRQLLDRMQKADKKYEENKIPAPGVVTQWFDSWTGGQPQPPTEGQSTLFQLQYGEVYDMYYAQTLDADQAQKLAMAHVAEDWGVTETGGQKQVSWLPPEKALTTLWSDLDGDGELELVQQTPEQARESFDFAVKMRYGLENYAVVANDATKRALEQGTSVPYGIIPLDVDGNPSYGYPELLELLTGEPFVYDYAHVQSSLRVLLTNRDLLKQDLQDAREAGPAAGETEAGYQGRLLDLEIKIQDLNKKIGR